MDQKRLRELAGVPPKQSKKELLQERDEGFDVREAMTNQQIAEVLGDLSDTLKEASGWYGNDNPEAGHKHILHVLETLETLIISSEI